ncbi:MAG: amino acid adenylation domain-containing protein [Hungatella sp.]|nr:amino acid adenylation domain-containing protein [Hungatella sp.]
MIKSVLDYLENSASLYGERCAYRDGRQSLTFHQVRAMARSVGTGIGRLKAFNRPVAVFMEKSPSMVAAFLGAVYGGCCYCPIDTAMPQDRLLAVIKALDPAAVIAGGAQMEQVQTMNLPCPVYEFDRLCGCEEDGDLLDGVRERRTDADPLYILFTSGSTGVPKGVVVSHRVIINNMEWLEEEYGFGPEDVWGNQAPLYFDVSDHDIYCPLKFGCSTVFIPPEHFAFPANLMAFLNDQKVTGIFWVPFALSMAANFRALEVQIPRYLNYVFFAGEVMPLKSLNYWRRYVPDAVYCNMYGPTETYVCTYYNVDREFGDGETLPIGRPCGNVGLLVLDKENRLILPGSGGEGELCVRGCTLASGYYSDPERTKEKFVQNPLNLHYPETIYRTGDMVSYNERGELIYHDRMDSQIKRLGYRIELGEIEAASGNVPGIRDCACVYDQARQMILFFYTGQKTDKKELSRGLSAKLPKYMMPNRYVYLEEMPRNANGKIDRKKLKEFGCSLGRL